MRDAFFGNNVRTYQLDSAHGTVWRSFTSEVWHDVPAATICIPYGLLEEDPEQTILPTLRMLEPIAETDGPYEVLIWANCLKGRDTDSVQEQLVLYQQFLWHLEQLVGLNSRSLRVVCKYSPMQEAYTANEVRADFMDALAENAHLRNYPADHPVIWLDADTVFMHPRTVPRLINALRYKIAHFAHANLLFTDTVSEVPYSARTVQEQVVAIYSLTRQLLESKLGPYDDRGYIEECGLAMTLETYLRTGGVGFTGPDIGESKVLFQRARQHLDPSVPMIAYVPGTLIGTSDRYFLGLAMNLPPQALPHKEEGLDYFGHVASLARGSVATTSLVQPATRQDLWEMINFMAQRQETRTTIRPALTTKELRQLGSLMTTWGFE